jgi:hypothetical protein
MLAPPPPLPPRGPLVGGKRRRGDRCPPPIVTATMTQCLLHDCRGRGRLNLGGTCRGLGWGATFFPRQGAHHRVAPRRGNSDSNDGGGRGGASATMVTADNDSGRGSVASGLEVQYWGYSTSRYPRNPWSCLRRFRVIFGRYLFVRYLGNRTNQNIDQISPKQKPASRALGNFQKR